MCSQFIKKNNVIKKIEELLNCSSNRYNITLQVAQRPKRKKYEDLDIVSEPEIKPVIRAIIEMANKRTSETSK